MALFDAICSKCRTHSEVYADSGKGLRLDCPCGGVVTVVWLKAPGVVGAGTPYFDTQLGVEVSSRQHRDRLLKERGLVALGPDEYRRTQSQLHAEAAPDNSGAFREAMTKAWSDVKSGNVPRVHESDIPSIDTSEMISAPDAA